MHSDKIISSAADDFVTNPFNPGYIDNINDLLNFDFIFLQHGITKDDISGWLNKFNKNIKLFVTAAKPEYDSIIKGAYGYTKKEVILSGFPRYDYLGNDNQRKLIIAPTWRKHLVSDLKPGQTTRGYDDSFKKSEYYKFYQDLIADEKLNTVLKQLGMTGEFYIHPSLSPQARDFKSTERIKVKEFPYNYATAFKEGDLLLTDYSSVAFDFAYLKKPVVYAQFDRHKFYENHIYEEGYFSYEKDGFGPVASDYTQTIDILLKSLKDGCTMPLKYQERLNDFFARTDKSNSQRVYQAILSLNKSNISEVNKPSRFLLKRHKNRNKEPLKVFWWRYNYPLELNFGDELMPYLLYSIWGIECKWSPTTEGEIIGPGSILDIVKDQERNIKVWGSGFIREGDSLPPESKLDFYAVRGPKTLSRVKSVRHIALGDPGILANIIFKKNSHKTHKIGIVFHYVDRDASIIEQLKGNPGVLLIDPLQPPSKVARDITSCEIVFSSSLHGLIFADSFKVPNYWMPLSDNVTGGSYKFEDYYSSTNRELKKVTPEVLNDEARVETLKKEYEKIPNLKKMQKDLIKSFPYN